MTPATDPATPGLPAVRAAAGPLAVAENTVTALFLAVMIALPIAEIVLRALFGFGIQGSTSFVQHATLAVGMLGAAIAARDGRLLTLATTAFLSGRARTFAALLGGAVGAAVACAFALASWEFVAVEREAGSVIAYGVPEWVTQLFLPAGFVLIAWRLVRRSAATAGGRVVAGAVAALCAWLVAGGVVAPSSFAWPGVVVVLVALALGAPVFAGIGGCALLLLLADDVPLAAVALNHYGIASNQSLPAIPMFTLAGYLLAESGAPARLLEVFGALFGRFRGGAAIVTVVASTFFTCFTGASGVSILTLGGLVMPLLVANGFGPRRALGLVTAGGLPGVILMPALPLLLYAIVSGQGIEDMFTAGLLPAALMFTVLVVWALRQQGTTRAPAAAFSWQRALRALAAAKWELSLPLVPLVALGTSLATPVEAAAFTAAYALLIVTVFTSDLRAPAALVRVVTECSLLVGGILLVLGVAMSLTNYMVDAQIPVRIVDWVTHHVDNRWVFLGVLNVVLLLAGCVMDVFTAIVVLVPLVAPLGAALGVHPAHLGIVFLANLEIGYLTPPVGMNLFFASYRFGKPVHEVFRAVAPIFAWLAAALVVITYVPFLSTALLSR